MADAATAETTDLATLGVEFVNKGGAELGASMDANTAKAEKLENTVVSLKTATSELSKINLDSKAATNSLTTALDGSNKSATGLLSSIRNYISEIKGGFIDGIKQAQDEQSKLNSTTVESVAGHKSATLAISEHSKAGDHLGEVLGELFGAVIKGESPVAALTSRISTQRIVSELAIETLGGLSLAFGAVAVAAVVTIAAIYSYEQSVKKLEDSSLGAGRANNLNAESLDALATSAASASKVSIASAEGIVASYNKAGIAGDSIESLTEVTKRYGEALGIEVPAATAKLTEALADPAKAIETWADQLGGINQKEIEHIDLIERENGKTAAQAEAIHVLVGRLKEQEVEVDGLAGVWQKLSNKVSDTWHNLAKFIALKVGAEKEPDSADFADEALNSYEDQIDKKSREVASYYDRVAPKAKQRKDLLSDINALEKAEAGSIQAALSPEQRLTALTEQRKKLADLDKQPKAKVDPSIKHAEMLQRELDAIKANAQGELDMADAYDKGAYAVIEETAKRDANTKAIKSQGDAQKFYLADLQLGIDKEIASVAKTTKAQQDKTDALTKVNEAVEDGSLTLKAANDQSNINLAVSDAQNVADHLQGDQKTKLLSLITSLKSALQAYNQQQAIQQVLSQNITNSNTVELAETELSLIGKSNAERAITIAQLQEQQRLQSLGVKPGTVDPVSGVDIYDQAVQKAKDAAQATTLTSDAQASYNEQLSITEKRLQDVVDLGKTAASDLSQAFGTVGDAIGGMTNALTDYATQQEKVNDTATKEYEIATTNLVAAQALNDQEKINAAQKAQTQALAKQDQQSAILQVKAYGDMTASAQKFFKEGTFGYNALGAANKAFRTIEFALSVKALATDIAHTATWLANSGLRAAANGVEAVTKALASLPFPLNLAAGAATAAAVVALGVSLVGGGGGGASAATPDTTAADLQKTTGAGTVLGSANDKSDSIAKSLDEAQKAQNKDLEYSNQMVVSLKSIDSNIQSLTGALARSLNVSGGALNTSGVNVGTSASGNFLFGSTKSTELVDNGIAFGSQKLTDIINNAGIAAASYIASKTTSSSSFLGISLGSSTKGSTTTQGLDSDLQNQITAVIKSLRTGVLTAASTLGLDGAEATLNSFVVNLGKVSFKDLDAQGIQDELNAVFGKLGDQMATAVLGDITKYQQAGEGALQTLTRVARGYQVVDVSLDSIGRTFGAVGTASIYAREHLLDLSGGIDNFSSQASEFQQDFLTEAEQMAPVQKAVSDALSAIGESSITTKEQFKDLVLGLDLTTDQGASMYAQLMNIAPAFAKVTDYTDKLNGVVDDASNALDIANKKRQLEITLMQTTGDAAGALAAQRQDELAALDPSLQAIQEQIYAAQDATTAQQALAQAQENAAKLAQSQSQLQIQLYQATGDAASATALQRQNELQALDDSLKPLQEQVYAAEDAAAAQQALAEAQKTAADDAAAAQTALAEAQKIAADAAAQLADETTSLQIQLLQAKGDTAGATSLQRQTDLAKLDPSLQSLQQAIYDATDAATANAAAVQVATDATNAHNDAIKSAQDAVTQAQQNVADAYKNEADAINTNIDNFKKLADSLDAYMQTLNTGTDAQLSPEEQYSTSKAAFQKTASAAASGDATAIGNLQSVSEDYLKASKDYFASSQGYFDDLAAVKDAVSSSEKVANDQVSLQQQQLDALNSSVKGIVNINTSVLSVKDALAAYESTMEKAFNIVNNIPANDNTATSQLDNQGYGAFFNNGDQGFGEAQGSASAEASASLSRGLGSMQSGGYDLVNGLVYGPNGGTKQYNSDADAIKDLGLVKDGALYDRTIGTQNPAQMQDDETKQLLRDIKDSLNANNMLSQAVAQQTGDQLTQLADTLDKQNRIVARAA